MRNKQLLRSIITILLSTFIFLCISTRGLGQGGLNYSIGFTTTLSLNNVSVPTNTNPLLITEDKKCINLDNGLSKFMLSPRGLFNLSCSLDTGSKKLAFILYPNPVIDNYVVVKLTTLPVVTGSVLVKMLSTEGRLVMVRSVTIAGMKNGLRIPLQGIHPGIYTVNLSLELLGLSESQKLIIIK